MISRRQASLFLDNEELVESMRLKFNPIQARLIPAHVTLCREDEVQDWSAFRSGMQSLGQFELSLHFDTAVRKGDLVFLPVTDGAAQFHELRRTLLGAEPRSHQPHMTIIHPRNGQCSDSIFEEIQRLVQPFSYTFRQVTLIEQFDGGVWYPF